MGWFQTTVWGAALSIPLLFTNTAIAQEAPSTELQELRAASLETRRELQTSILTSGIVSVVAGVALIIPNSYDQGLRYAGINTLGFGIVNTIVGGVALHGIASETAWDASQNPQTRDASDRYSAHALADESREAWGHAINLGLAGAYAAIGGMAIAVSQAGVSHPNRWLGSGVAIVTQATHLAIVDLVGTVMARDFERRMREVSPTFGFDPSTRDAFVGASFSKNF